MANQEEQDESEVEVQYNPIKLKVGKTYRKRNPEYCVNISIPPFAKIVFKTAEGEFLGDDKNFYKADGRIFDGNIDSEMDLVVEAE